LNEEYIKNPEELISEKIFSKLPSEFEMDEYYQTFSDKRGFERFISFGLICNKGPESLTYIKNIKYS
jgi:hypothetical protein